MLLLFRLYIFFMTRLIYSRANYALYRVSKKMNHSLLSIFSVIINSKLLKFYT